MAEELLDKVRDVVEGEIVRRNYRNQRALWTDIMFIGL